MIGARMASPIGFAGDFRMTSRTGASPWGGFFRVEVIRQAVSEVREHRSLEQEDEIIGPPLLSEVRRDFVGHSL